MIEEQIIYLCTVCGHLLDRDEEHYFISEECVLCDECMREKQERSY